MKIKFTLLVFAILHASTILADQVVIQPPSTDDEVFLTINGIEINRDVLIAFRDTRNGPALPQDPAQAQNQLVNELVTTVVLAQEAEKRGLPQRKSVQNGIAMARRVILSNAMLQDYMANTTITESDIKEFYERQYNKGPKPEYKARHILVETEEKAKKLIGELKIGTSDFAETAKKHSTGPSSTNGGDLGWFSADTMTKNFANAVAVMKPGETSNKPVKTEFGWHIIKLEEKRLSEPPAPPEFETVKAQIKATLTIDKVRKKIREMSDAAVIKTPEAKTDKRQNND